MTEKPILFSTEMIRQIFAGRKTQTRRLINPQPPAETVCIPLTLSSNDAVHGTCTPLDVDYFSTANPSVHSCGKPIRCPYWADRLWVRETWQAIHAEVDPETGIGDDYRHATTIPLAQPPGDFWTIAYKADRGWAERRDDRGFPWRPGIHMPRWACRLVLDVKSIRAERLHDIECCDIRAEGISCPEHDFPGGFCTSECPDLRGAFGAGWDKLNGKRPGGSWADNPWVWAITFEVSDAI